MPRDYQQMSLDPNESSRDFANRLFNSMKEMSPGKFAPRPLPQNPTIRTFRAISSLQHNIEFWKDTCPMCRPIVRDLKVFCDPQNVPSTFQDQNIFICWNVVFSELASVIMVDQISTHDLDSTEDVSEESIQNEHIMGKEGVAQIDEQRMKRGESAQLLGDAVVCDLSGC